MELEILARLARSSTPSERIHALDTLRAAAMLLGIFLHAAIAYMKIDLPWAVRDERQRWVFDLFVGVVHGFRMQLFFLIAGFFAQLVCQRLGPAAFARHRFQRLVLPFAAGMIFILPFVHQLFQGQLSFWATAHLWFLQYLILYCAAAALAVALLPGAWQHFWARKTDAWMTASLPRFWRSLALAAPLFLCMWFSPRWGDVDGGPGASFLPKFRSLAYYGIFFAFGWSLRRNATLLPLLSRRLWTGWTAALLAFAIAGGTALFEDRRDHPQWLALKVTCLGFGAIYTWLMIFNVIGFFLRCFQKPNPLMRYAADASYWCSLIHLPLVVWLQAVLAPLPWDSLLKFAVVNTGSLAILFASYQILVRHTFIGAILNGPRNKAATL